MGGSAAKQDQPPGKKILEEVQPEALRETALDNPGHKASQRGRNKTKDRRQAKISGIDGPGKELRRE